MLQHSKLYCGWWHSRSFYSKVCTFLWSFIFAIQTSITVLVVHNVAMAFLMSPFYHRILTFLHIFFKVKFLLKCEMWNRYVRGTTRIAQRKLPQTTSTPTPTSGDTRQSSSTTMHANDTPHVTGDTVAPTIARTMQPVVGDSSSTLQSSTISIDYSSVAQLRLSFFVAFVVIGVFVCN